MPAVVLVLLLGLISGGAPAAAEQARLLRDGFPKCLIFRAGEQWLLKGSPERAEWLRRADACGGLVGKMANEELQRIPHSGEPSRFVRLPAAYDRHHPDRLVIWHIQSVQRDPRFDGDAYFAGHWLYNSGTTLTNDVPASSELTRIELERPARVPLYGGRGQRRHNERVLVPRQPDGSLNWFAAEQVVVRAKAPDGGRIVWRGQYGTKPRAFQAQRTYVACHVAAGPYEGGQLVWMLNLSAGAPHDAQGATLLTSRCRTWRATSPGACRSSTASRWTSLPARSAAIPT